MLQCQRRWAFDFAQGGTQPSLSTSVTIQGRQQACTRARSGHLRGLSATDVYRYLRAEHHATTVGLLLGLGAAHAGTCHAATSTMLFLHVPSRHPQVPPVHPSLQLRSRPGLACWLRACTLLQWLKGVHQQIACCHNLRRIELLCHIGADKILCCRHTRSWRCRRRCRPQRWRAPGCCTAAPVTGATSTTDACGLIAICQLNAYHCSLIHSKPVIREKTTPATPNRQMAEIMVEEIGRRASGEPANNNTTATAVLPVSSHREGYALAAGAALGLVTLGSGRSAPGISDLQLEDRLRCGLPACSHGPESDATPDRPCQGAPRGPFGDHHGCDMKSVVSPHRIVVLHSGCLSEK